MQSTPLISVVIPTFNRAELLKRSLKSVLSQTYSNIEVIVVDDNSSDSTVETIKGISDPRVRYIRHEERKGGASARNSGILASKGEFISFLDSDDTWVPKKLESQLNFFHQNKCTNDCILFAKVIMNTGAAKIILPYSNTYDSGQDISDYIFIHDGLIHTIVLFMKTELARKIMFKEDLKKHQDYDFVLRAFNMGAGFLLQNEILAEWHVEDRSDRMGKKVEYDLSYSWLKSNKHLFSNKAYKGFIKRDIIPQVLLKKFSLRGLLFLMSLVWKGELTIPVFLKTAVKLFVWNPFR
jgi:glycosyltransferase involved in cell wall biosynthesis